MIKKYMSELKYDIKKVVEFLGGGIDETIVASLIGIFVSSVNDEFPAFAEAIAADDKPSIHKIGHKLKGSSANLGFESFRKICEDLEQHARNNLDFDYKTAFEKLGTEKKAIEDWFSSVKADYGL